jgi:ABC-type polysaccharide/polyol phosphate export permease
VYIVVLFGFTIGVGLVVSALTVYFRDLRQIIPLLLQFGLFATPIIWPLTEIPREWRVPYCALNPVGGVIDGLRRVVLYGEGPQWAYLGASAASAAVLLVCGYALFKRLETGFADVS